MDCENEEVFKERYFIVSRCPESNDEEGWLENVMKKQYGIEHYCIAVDVFGDDRGLIDSAVCRKCGSQNIRFDF
ncbi:MAG: hypothetical protein L6244_02750 [Candidatus Methanoperedenaceae archaeon]|nr:hypothetical protein [Candidatus Methanoperedenaceae archaeon]